MKRRISLEARPFKNIFDKYDTETGRYYNRIAGGIGWPGQDEKGAVTVWGEELTHRPTEKPKIFLLAEFESHSISELVEKAIFFKSDLYADPVIAQRDHADYLRFRNKEARENREPEIYFQQPQKVDGSLEYYLAIINDLLRSSNKRLYLGEQVQSRIPSLLQQMPDGVAGLSVKDFPLLASCGYVVSAMTMVVQHTVRYNPKQDKVETEYDLYRDFKR